MKNLFFFFALALTLALSTGCGGDDDDGVNITPGCTEMAFTQAVQDAVQSLNDATQAYVNDQSTANCDAWKAAAQNYLDEVKRFENCATLNTRQDFRDAVREAEESLANTTC
ncbi:MAG: hypothetical protein AAGJ82_12560 [Bacteroidota bacterium]